MHGRPRQGLPPARPRPAAPRAVALTQAPRGVQATARAIATMQVRGAHAIGNAAAQALAAHLQAIRGGPAQVRAAALAAARRLDAARPTAVTLHNSLGWVLQAVRRQRGADTMRQAAREEADAVVARATAARGAIARHGARRLRDGMTVLTHCNSSTAAAILAEAHRDGKALQVIATETRPFRQGLRTLRDLTAAGLRPDFIVDSAVEHTLATRDVDVVLVGADAVTRDGSLFNKIGTAGVAQLAAVHKVPFLAAAGVAKFTRRRADEVVIEERSPDEVLAPADRPRGVRVLNPVFDRTPPTRIRAYVTERGLRAPRDAVAQSLKLLPPERVWT